MTAPIAVQVNLINSDLGIEVVPFSEYDVDRRVATEIGRFIIPWHQVADIWDRMQSIEKSKVERDAGISEF